MFRKVTAAMAAAVMMMTNVMFPITAFAGEENVQAASDGSEKTEAEAAFFHVYIPYFNEMDVKYDSQKLKETRQDGSSVLQAMAGEDIDLTLTVNEHYGLDQIKAVRSSGKDTDLFWKDENTITFSMPDEDVALHASFHEILPETTEFPEETSLEEEHGEMTDTGETENGYVEQQDSVTSDMNTEMTVEEEPAADQEAGEMSGEENSTASVPTETTEPVDAGDGQMAEGDVTERDGNVSMGGNMESEGSNDIIITGDNTTASDSPDEVLPDSASEDSSVVDMALVIDESLENDGYPMQGSVIRVHEIEISSDMSFMEPETAFDDVSYDQSTCTVTRMADETLYGIPGTYEMLSRVDENTTGKFWYVIRPIRVVEREPDTEAVTESPTEEDADEEETDEEDAESDPQAETDVIASENMEDGSMTDMSEAESTVPETEDQFSEEIAAEPEPVQEIAEIGAVHNILFDTGEGYHIAMEGNQLTFQEGDDVSFTVMAEEEYSIKKAEVYAVAYEDGETAAPAEQSRLEETPVLITDEKITVSQTASSTEDGKTVEASYSFEMPDEDVVVMASVMLAASGDVSVELENGSIKNVPSSWVPAGHTWANGGTTFGYSVYRTVTMPDGKERKAYCLQPALGAVDDGKYTATEVRKKGKISESEALLLRKALFYCYGGPGWDTGVIKNILSDCDNNDEYYAATHYILAKIYCDATNGNWNIATSGGVDYTAVNDRGKAQIEAAISKLKKLEDPSASLAPIQVAGVYNEVTGFSETQAVRYESSVEGNNLTITLPAGVYLETGGTTYNPGEKAVISPGSSFILKKKDYEAAHEQTIKCKSAVFTDFDAYLINVAADAQNMGFSYVADKDFELSVTWPDMFTHISIMKFDACTGSSNASPGYSIDGAVYGIYADPEKTQLLEQLTINGGSAVSSDNYVIGRTYYVAEISAPALYAIDTNVYPVMAVAGGTATITSSDVPKTIKISVQKVDAETGEARPMTGGLSFEGGVFGIFTDEACTTKAVDINGDVVADIRTDASGHAQTGQSLLIGSYYVKELAAPAGYLVNDSVFSITADQVRDEIINQDANVELTCEEQVIRANMELMKVKTLKGLNTEAAEGVAFTFTYVNDPTVRFTVIDGLENTVITDEEGFATTASDRYPNGTLIYGEWEITESNTPEGFECLDPTRFTITGNGRTYRFVANNRQIHAAVLIEKQDANTLNRIPVAGVKFQIFKDGEVVQLFNSTTRVYEDTWTTDEDGMVQLPEMLDYGTYTLKEDPESIPAGYFVMEDTPFTVEEMADDFLHPITLTAMEPPQMGNIMVEKRDAKSDETLEGFTFEIVAAEDITDPAGVIRTGTDADGSEILLTAGTVVDRITTGENGNAVSKDLFLGHYTVRETGVTNGYAIEKETQDVWIMGDTEKARKGENISEYVLFANHPTTVKILKVDAKTDAPLEGITFLVHKLEEGETIADYRYTGEEEGTGEIDAQVISGGEADGKEETINNPDAADPNISTDTDPTGNDTDNGSAKDTGEDGGEADTGDETQFDGGNNIDTSVNEGSGEGAYEEIGQTSGLDESCLSEDELFVTDENGEIMITHLDANSTYVIREIKTIPGYNLSHELVSFNVDTEGLIDGSYIKEVIMENEPTIIYISKQDITNSEELPGAHLTITDSEGEVVAEWTSTYEIHEIQALPAGTYTLTEVTAPEGYEETESITFKVITSCKIQAVTMKDAPYREVEVSKTDITGDKEIVGAHLAIMDMEGNEIDSWESTAQEHTVRLHSGEYVLTERKPADGYVTAESIPFIVIRTSATDYEVMGVQMKDDVTKVEITKSDITDGKPVIGAELVIKDQDGNELHRWTTTQDPYYFEMLPIGTYTLTETMAPSGYATAETVTFNVEDTGEIQKVDMKDTPISVEISKKDIADGAGGNELPGAHLTVKNEAGEVIDDWTSTSEPHKISMLPVGRYSLIEVTAPNGYELAETISFEITDSGEVQKVTMYDSPKEETVDLTGKKKKTTTKASYTPSSGFGGTSVVGPVKTGDESPILRYIVIALAAIAMAGAVVILRRKLRLKV